MVTQQGVPRVCAKVWTTAGAVGALGWAKGGGPLGNGVGVYRMSEVNYQRRRRAFVVGAGKLLQGEGAQGDGGDPANPCATVHDAAACAAVWQEFRPQRDLHISLIAGEAAS